jgi:hypothetical protein
MPTLSKNAIAGYAQNAGFKGDEIKIATAIAMAESGGNTKAHNAVPPDDSYGLWQINMLGALGRDRQKRFHLASYADLYNPVVNARAAYSIYKGSGWQAWTTYTRGTYKKFLTDVTPEKPTGLDIDIIDAAKEKAGELNPLNGVSESINAFGETVFKATANIQGIAFAGLLLVMGVLLLMRGTVSKFIPAGKVGKLAKGVLNK